MRETPEMGVFQQPAHGSSLSAHREDERIIGFMEVIVKFLPVYLIVVKSRNRARNK